MTSATVEDLFINPRIITRAKIRGYVSLCSILRASQSELQQKLALTAADVEQLTTAAANYILPQKLSAWEMQNTDQERFLHITTGCHQLDDFLGGGIPVRGLTEVTGESGSGKTQLVLQLALYAQLPPISGGLGKGVAYICTESQFSSNRLQQLISHIRNKYPKGPKSYTDNIFVHHVPDMDNLVDCVRYQLPHLISSRHVGLVVIDSVAAPFRVEDRRERNTTLLLQTLGYRLHQLTSSHNIAVVAINQVTAAMGKQSLYGLEGNTAPALGLSWANLVTTRLMLTRTHSFVRTHKLLPQTTVEFNIRKLEVVFCPWLRRKSFSFIVTEKGIEDIAMSTV
ncbi:DNA repair protein XRCC3-like isoform X1 [Homarus americanus]|uniref:DNA repair protein XRCC3-like isoform X1 n=1 Tax=Homarus americanus TaxID=6706 RepID=UPI001C4810A7|nr:DNA repair protein XRCC3-like isoform X1 [Homarus americanus]